MENQIISAVIMLIAIAHYVIRHIEKREKENLAKWDGVIDRAFLEAEKNPKARTREQKETLAQSLFEKMYREEWGITPDEATIREAKGEFSKKAFELKFAAEKPKRKK